MRKKQENNFNKIYRNSKNLKIDIVGIGSGVGVTHICICIANYINMNRKNKVAIIANEDDADYKALKNNLETYSLGEFSFHLKGIDYFYIYPNNMHMHFNSAKYSHIIFDYGDRIKDFIKEYKASDIKLVVFALNEWNTNKIEEFLEVGNYDFLKSCIFIYVFGDEKNRKRIERRYHIKIYKFPYIISPYYNNKEVFKFLNGEDMFVIG